MITLAKINGFYPTHMASAHSGSLIRTFSRFLGVGALGFLIDASIFFSMQAATSLSVFWCKASATIVAMTATWILNRYLTFQHRAQGPIIHEYLTYMLASCVGASLNVITVSMLARVDGHLHIAAFVAGSAAGLLFNFISYDKIVFARRLQK